MLEIRSPRVLLPREDISVLLRSVGEALHGKDGGLPCHIFAGDVVSLLKDTACG